MDTLQGFLADLWERSGYSLADIAAGANLSRQAVWRAIRGTRSPRGETLAAIMRGFGFDEASREYQQAITLWTRQQTRRPRIRPRVAKDQVSRLQARIQDLTQDELDVLESLLSSRKTLGFVAAVVHAAAKVKS